MGSMSIWHWVIVGLLVVVLFGRGKISEMMGDVAKGIKALKKGMAEDDTATATTTTTTTVHPVGTDPVRNIEHQPGGTAAGAATTDRKVV